MSKKVFCDFHHQGLLDSLVLLFEKRLGWKLYTPQGISWFDSGNWLISRCYGEGARNTAVQFLESGVPADGTLVLHPHRGITWEGFKNTQFDLLMATHIDHIALYRELSEKYQHNAPCCVQYGNEWPIHPLTKNLLSSTAPFPIPDHINRCWYHQEIDQAVFKPSNAFPSRKITSFSNAMPLNDIFRQDWKDFLHLESLLPTYIVKSFGGGCRDGSLSQEDVAKEMNDSQWIVHFKTGGDGFGHVLHSAFACGTPVIYKGSQYKGKLGGELLTHLQTGLDAEIMGLEGVASYIESLSLDDISSYRDRVLERFRQKVDYDKEEGEIRDFLTKLL